MDGILHAILAVDLNEGSCGLQRIIRIDEILFSFLGSVAARQLIGADWAKQPLFRPDRVYLRTEASLSRTQFRSVGELKRRLPDHFDPANRALLANLRLCDWADLRSGAQKLLGFRCEWLVVRRRSEQRIRKEFGAELRSASKKPATRPETRTNQPKPADRLRGWVENVYQGSGPTPENGQPGEPITR